MRPLSQFFVLLTLLVFAWTASAQERADKDAPPAYVGTDQCTDCHTAEAHLWAGSHHAAAWTPVTPRTVLGDFTAAPFAHDGTLTEFEDRGDSLHVSVTEADGTKSSWPVHSVVGIEPLQQYLLETEPGRLQSFDVVWDTVKNEWYHLYPELNLTPDNGLHWSRSYKNWNARCAACHATEFDKKFDPVTNTYASTQSEIGVGCEACHGPGQAHVTWAREGTLPEGHSGLSDLGLSVDLAAGGDTLMDQCASCHARRDAFDTGNPLPGTAFDDAYRLSLLREGAYHADGQILDEVYVYGSFLQSKMYAKGVTCNDCHDPHSGARVAQDNAVCTQCHNPSGNPRFPSLALAEYDSSEHHQHAQGSDGALCKSCHMIERVYMGTDGRRDHSFRVPRPDLSMRLGTPNACNDCHTDQSAAWAFEQVQSWYPDSAHRGPHYGDVLAAGRFDPASNREDLLALGVDTSQPGIVRATALSLLVAVTDPEIAAITERLLQDPDARVRAQAVELQRGVAPDIRVARLTPLLRDARKSVRITTARTLFELPPQALSGEAASAMRGAMDEWQLAMVANFDFPEQQLVLGGIGLTLRDFRQAEASFARAVALDPQLIDAWSIRIRMAEALGDMARAGAILKQAMEANPGDMHLTSLRARIPTQP